MKDSVLEKCLQETGSVLIRPTGTSMRPLLKEGHSAVLLEKCCGFPQKGDIILYRRHGKEGILVLHRVWRIEGKRLIVCGDHQWKEKEIVDPDQVLAVAKGFYRGSVYTDCSDKRYRIYVGLWNSNMFVRRCCFLVLKILGFD